MLSRDVLAVGCKPTSRRDHKTLSGWAATGSDRPSHRRGAPRILRASDTRPLTSALRFLTSALCPSTSTSTCFTSDLCFPISYQHLLFSIFPLPSPLFCLHLTQSSGIMDRTIRTQETQLSTNIEVLFSCSVLRSPCSTFVCLSRPGACDSTSA